MLDFKGGGGGGGAPNRGVCEGLVQVMVEGMLGVDKVVDHMMLRVEEGVDSMLRL